MTVQQAQIEQQAAQARDFLVELFKRLPAMLEDHNRTEAGFRKRCYKRWKPGMDLLKMFLVMSQEIGSAYNTRARPQAVADYNYKFEAIVALHARSIRVANEILALLREGFPDGALSRWRTLHEVAVIATFLTGEDKEVSRRFIAHRGVVSCKALRQYQEYLPRSNMTPLEPGALDFAERQREALIQEFGKEFGEEMGWAYPIIPKRRGINLHDLEVATGLDHWRPRFRWASDDIHASAKPYHASLSAAEVAFDKPVLVVGQSNSAFTDPAHMCVISLNLANHALPDEYRTEDEEMQLLALRILSDVLGETFLEIERETSRTPARAASAGQGPQKIGRAAR